MPDQDAAAIDAVAAVKRAHQRGLAGAGGPGERHALARRAADAGAVEHGDAGAALQMQDEGFGQALGLEHDHACSTELTRSWV